MPFEHHNELGLWCRSRNEVAVPCGIWASALGHDTKFCEERHTEVPERYHRPCEAWCDAPARVPVVRAVENG